MVRIENDAIAGKHSRVSFPLNVHGTMVKSNLIRYVNGNYGWWELVFDDLCNSFNSPVDTNLKFFCKLPDCIGYSFNVMLILDVNQIFILFYFYHR